MRVFAHRLCLFIGCRGIARRHRILYIIVLYEPTVCIVRIPAKGIIRAKKFRRIDLALALREI